MIIHYWSTVFSKLANLTGLFYANFSNGGFMLSASACKFGRSCLVGKKIVLLFYKLFYLKSH